MCKKVFGGLASCVHFRNRLTLRLLALLRTFFASEPEVAARLGRVLEFLRSNSASPPEEISMTIKTEEDQLLKQVSGGTSLLG